MDKYEERHEMLEQFSKDFARLVRRYMPEYPNNAFDADTLAMMQDRTSCYNPYVWDEEQ